MPCMLADKTISYTTTQSTVCEQGRTQGGGRATAPHRKLYLRFLECHY